MSKYDKRPGPGIMGRLAPISWGLLLLIVIFVVYVGLLRNAMKSYTYAELVEVAHQCAQVMRKQLQGDFQTLDLVASMLAEQDSFDEVNVLPALKRLSANGLFKRTGLVLADGRLLGTEIMVRNRAYMASAFAGETGVSSMLPDRKDGEDVNVYYAPVYSHGRVSGVLLAVRNALQFKPLLDITCFGGAGFFAMVDENGVVISTSPHLENLGIKDIFTGLREHGTFSAENVDSLRREMSDGRSSVYDLTFAGKPLYMSVTPIEINDWSLLTFVPAKVVDQLTTRIFSGVIILVAIILTLLSLLAGYIFISERRHRGALRRSMSNLSSLTENIPGGVLQCADDGEFTVSVASDGFYDLIGMSPDDLRTRYDNQLMTLIDDRDQLEARQQLATQLATGKAFDISYRLRRADGEQVCVQHRGQKTDDGGGSVLNCVLLDETETREAMRAKLFNAQRHRLFFDFSDAILYEFDMRTGDISHSQQFTEKFGYPPQSLNFPQSAIDSGVVHPEDIMSFVALYDRLYDGELRSEGELRLRTASGNFLWCHIQNVAVLDEDNVCTLVLGKITDIDARKRQMESLRDGALRDPFTQLYNKVATKKLISEHLEEGGEENPGVLCVIDLDKFKDVNDNHGHMFGDKVLAAVADAMRDTLPASSIIGRIGGDEFVAYIRSTEEGLNSVDSARLAAQLCRLNVDHDGTPFPVSCSIGVSRFPQDGSTYDALYGMADDALYASKKSGRGRCTLYEEGPVMLVEGAGENVHSHS